MTGWGSLASDTQEARSDNNDITVLPSDLKFYESDDCRSSLFCNSFYLTDKMNFCLLLYLFFPHSNISPILFEASVLCSSWQSLQLALQALTCIFFHVSGTRTAEQIG